MLAGMRSARDPFQQVDTMMDGDADVLARALLKSSPKGRQACRLSFGSTPQSPAKFQWTLCRNDTGAPLVLPSDAGELLVQVDGRFDGAALTIELSHDGIEFVPAAASVRSPRAQRLAVRPKILRPAVAGGGEFTTVVVTLTAQRAG
jgi:hypothetical protein